MYVKATFGQPARNLVQFFAEVPNIAIPHSTHHVASVASAASATTPVGRPSWCWPKLRMAFVHSCEDMEGCSLQEYVEPCTNPPFRLKDRQGTLVGLVLNCSIAARSESRTATCRAVRSVRVRGWMGKLRRHRKRRSRGIQRPRSLANCSSLQPFVRGTAPPLRGTTAFLG